jgi:hypothetical protein
LSFHTTKTLVRETGGFYPLGVSNLACNLSEVTQQQFYLGYVGAWLLK